jgi:hypothetical protein
MSIAERQRKRYCKQDHEGRQYCGSGHAAEHCGSDRLAARGASASSKHQRNNAKNEGESRHQDGTKPEMCGLHRRSDDAEAI